MRTQYLLKIVQTAKSVLPSKMRFYGQHPEAIACVCYVVDSTRDGIHVPLVSHQEPVALLGIMNYDKSGNTDLNQK